jgi:hypothetical protein
MVALNNGAVAPDIAVAALALAGMAARQQRAARRMALELLGRLVHVAAQRDGVLAAGNGALDEPFALHRGKVAHFVAFDVRADMPTRQLHVGDWRTARALAFLAAQARARVVAVGLGSRARLGTDDGVVKQLGVAAVAARVAAGEAQAALLVAAALGRKN